MATDSEGNFYFPDLFNNRILRYNNPFITNSTADYVWGQSDFLGSNCNRGLSNPDNRSLCLAPPPGNGSVKTGVAIDADKNLWIADTQNNRVLRFPFNSTLGIPAQEADLVLGQPNFTTSTSGSGTNQMHKPASVRVDDSGKIFVADGALGVGGSNPNSRVLVFHPPFSNGMPADDVLVSGMGEPTGLEIDPNGGLWVNDVDNQRLLYFVDGIVQTIVDSIPGGVWGGLGVDRDGNVMITGWSPQQVLRYSPPSYNWEATFFRADEYGSFNQLGPRGIYSSLGIEVTSGQLIVADGSRILFWNNVWNLESFAPADGVIGQPDFHTRPRWEPQFGKMRADNQGKLWVVKGPVSSTINILAYELPLKMGAEPILTISSPIPLKGGGEFTWTEALLISGVDIQPNCDCLWLSDRDFNRVFRIKDVSTPQRVVDIVLGQTGVSGTHCNQGRDSDDGYTHPTSPSQDSLCHPGGLAFDNYGNLYVADHNLEVAGTWRLLEFDANLLPTSLDLAVYGIPASRVFGRNGSFTEPYCQYDDPMCGPWEPAFDLTNQMVIGFNGYLGPPFPQVYQDPLTNPFPSNALGDYYSHPISARFDQFDNLYVVDGTRNRVLINPSCYLGKKDGKNP
jgi:sugar lactone lactonase YvrE